MSNLLKVRGGAGAMTRRVVFFATIPDGYFRRGVVWADGREVYLGPPTHRDAAYADAMRVAWALRHPDERMTICDVTEEGGR